MTIKLTLRELINKIDWVTITSGKPSDKLPDDGVSYHFFKSHKRMSKSDSVRLRFGNKVLEDLGWEINDKIVVMQDPDDLMKLLLVRSDHGKGRRLSRETNSSCARIQFKWQHNSIPADEPIGVPIKYEIYKSYISFRMEKIVEQDANPF